MQWQWNLRKMCRAVQTWRNRTDKAGQRSFSEKQLEDGYRLACQSYPAGAYEVEIPESEETIVLQSGGSKEKMDAEGLTEADTQTPAEAKNKRRHTGQRNSRRNGRENRKCNLWNLHRHRNNDSGGTACESGNRGRLPDCCFR